VYGTAITNPYSSGVLPNLNEETQLQQSRNKLCLKIYPVSPATLIYTLVYTLREAS
jgi:hypothetical protein